MDKYSIAIIGCGNGGKALAGLISSKGYKVNLYEGLDKSTDYLKLVKNKRITLKGDIQCFGTVNCVTTNLEEAIDNTRLIIIVVPSFAHADIISKLTPLLKANQIVIFMPGNFGSVRLRNRLYLDRSSINVTIAETSSLPFACRTVNYNEVEIYRTKMVMKIASLPAKNNLTIAGIMNRYLDIFIPADNVLETSMDNINIILHPLPTLINIGGIESSPSEFRHYIDGITPSVSKLLYHMDRERMAVGDKYKISLTPIIDQLKLYYGSNDASSIHEFVHSENSPYAKITGHSISSRYITEDVPYLLVPIMQLGKKANVATSLFSACIDLASKLHNTDYINLGNNLNSLGMEKNDVSDILRLITK